MPAGVRLFDVEPWRERPELKLAGSKAVNITIAVAPGGKTLAVRHLNQTGAMLSFWDIQTGKRMSELPLREATRGSIAWSPDGRTLAVGYDDGSIGLFTPGE